MKGHQLFTILSNLFIFSSLEKGKDEILTCSGKLMLHGFDGIEIEEYFARYSPIVESIVFNLFTPNNSQSPQEIVYEDIGRTARYFNSNYETIFLIHGYIDGYRLLPWEKRMKDEFLKFGNYNIVIVDWSRAGAINAYPASVLLSYPVSFHLARMIVCLQETFGLDLSRTHLIGHSLGAHIAGNAGHLLAGKIGRISGLDPAGPLMEILPPILRLSPEDAQFVDNIHTNAGKLGMFKNCGHIDFYPNGGSTQPGCRSRALKARATTIYEDIGNLIVCSHLIVLDMYIYSVNPNNPRCLASSCNSYSNYLRGECHSCNGVTDRAYMGYPAKEQAGYARRSYPGSSGSFYVTTNQEGSFCG